MRAEEEAGSRIRNEPHNDGATAGSEDCTEIADLH